MKKRDYREEAETPYEEREIKDPQKDDFNGKRKMKRKDKDYEKKYGDREERWN